jgi:hypothetical protein
MEQIEKVLNEYLKFTGLLFPETNEEIEAVNRQIKEENFELPEHMKNPYAVLERGYIEIASKAADNPDDQYGNAYSLAARNFKNISAEALRKMEEDRKDAQNKD